MPQQFLILLFQFPKLYLISTRSMLFIVHIPSVNYSVLQFALVFHGFCLACGNPGKLMAFPEVLPLSVMCCLVIIASEV